MMLRNNNYLQKCLVGLMVLFAAMSSGSAYALLSSQPSVYEMSGKDVQITFTRANARGLAELSYRAPRISKVFVGDEVRILRSEIGLQVTVTLYQVPDLKTVTATVLIPDINLEGDAAAFKTTLLNTTHKTSIAGPDLVVGQVQSYYSRSLAGKASSGLALSSNLSGEVTLSPTCPGPVIQGQVCQQPYVGAAVQVLDESRNMVASAITTEKGMFDVYVMPGKYIIQVNGLKVSPIPLPTPIHYPGDPVLDLVTDDNTLTLSPYPLCPATPVAVPEQGSAIVSIVCDTGIR